MYIAESVDEGARIERKTDASETSAQMRWAGVAEGQTVLDLGCAAGTTTRILGNVVGPTGHVVGVDASVARTDEARAHTRHRPWIEYRAGMAEQIPAADGEFDAAWSRFLFEYLRRPTDAMREMVRVTKRGGIVAVADLDGNCVWHDPLPDDFAHEMSAALETLRPHGFDPYVGRTLFRLAKEAGLSDIRIDVQPYHVLAGRIDDERYAQWEMKIRAVTETLATVGWNRERASDLFERFMAHLRAEDTFTYSTLISVSGIVPLRDGPA